MWTIWINNAHILKRGKNQFKGYIQVEVKSKKIYDYSMGKHKYIETLTNKI